MVIRYVSDARQRYGDRVVLWWCKTR